MEMNNFGNTNNLLLSEIEDFELQESIHIPEEYKAFLLLSNGGRPKLDCFTLDDNSDSSMVHFFLGISLKERTHNLKYALSMFRERMPENLFPIAKDPGGNVITLGLSDNEQGKVYFWDYEEEAEDGVIPDMSNVHLIANSFASFLDGLHEDEEDEEDDNV